MAFALVSESSSESDSDKSGWEISSDDDEYEDDTEDDTVVPIPRLFKSVEFYATASGQELQDHLTRIEVSNSEWPKDMWNDIGNTPGDLQNAILLSFKSRGLCPALCSKAMYCMYSAIAEVEVESFVHGTVYTRGVFVKNKPPTMADGAFKVMNRGSNSYIVYIGPKRPDDTTFPVPSTPEKILKKRTMLEDHYDRDNLYFLTECVGLCMTLHKKLDIEPSVGVAKTAQKKRKRPPKKYGVRKHKKPKAMPRKHHITAPPFDPIAQMKASSSGNWMDGDSEIRNILLEEHATVALPKSPSPLFGDVLHAFTWQGMEGMSINGNCALLRKLRSGQRVFEPERMRLYVVQNLVPWLRARSAKFQKIAASVRKGHHVICTRCFNISPHLMQYDDFKCCGRCEYISYGLMTSMQMHFNECAAASNKLADEIEAIPPYRKSVGEITAVTHELCIKKHVPKDLLKNRIYTRLRHHAESLRKMGVVNIPDVMQPDPRLVCCNDRKIHIYKEGQIITFSRKSGKFLRRTETKAPLTSLHMLGNEKWWGRTSSTSFVTNKKPYSDVTALAMYLESGIPRLAYARKDGIYATHTKDATKTLFPIKVSVSAIAVKSKTMFAFARGHNVVIWKKKKKVDTDEKYGMPENVTGMLFAGKHLYVVCGSRDLYVCFDRKVVKVNDNDNDNAFQEVKLITRPFTKRDIDGAITKIDVYGLTLRIHTASFIYHCVVVGKRDGRLVLSSVHYTPYVQVYASEHCVAVIDDVYNVQMYTLNNDRLNLINTFVSDNRCVKCGEEMESKTEKMCSVCKTKDVDRHNFHAIAPEVAEIAERVESRARSITPDPALVIRQYKSHELRDSISPLMPPVDKHKGSPAKPGPNIVGKGRVLREAGAFQSWRRKLF